MLRDGHKYHVIEGGAAVGSSVLGMYQLPSPSSMISYIDDG